MDVRVGSGIDFHRLIHEPARRLMLGGIEIPGDLALQGHSDADVVLHALADAVLGALGLGDIGVFFPDSDPAFKNMDSSRILILSLQKAEEKGWRIGNVDITVLGEKPRIGPYRDAIRDNLARLMRISADRVGIKATTTEKMGALGREEGVGCMAVVLLSRAE